MTSHHTQDSEFKEEEAEMKDRPRKKLTRNWHVPKGFCPPFKFPLHLKQSHQMAESILLNQEMEAGSEGFVDEQDDASVTEEPVRQDNNNNGNDTVSEHSNASSCGEPLGSLKTQWNESASLSDSNIRAGDVQAQIKQKLRSLSPVKRRLDSQGQDSKRSKQKNRISQMISGASYRSKREIFNKLFVLNRGLPDDEQLITDFSCALQRDILVHGRLYLSQNWMCFYANIIGWETLVTIKWSDITAITKEKTARVIPNAIQVCTNAEKYFLTSFVSRENSYMSLFRIWQNALMGQPKTPQDLRKLCKRYRGQTRPRDDIEGYPGNDPDQDDAEETGDEVTENDTGQDDDHSFVTSENSQDFGQDQMGDETQDATGQQTRISVIPPSPTASDTPGHEDSTERSADAPLGVVEPLLERNRKEAVGIEDESTSPRPISPLARRAEHLMKLARRQKRPKKKPTKRTLVQLASVSLPVPDLDAEESTEMEEEGSLSSEEEQGDVMCPCHGSHTGKELVVEDYNFDIDALYEHLFSKDSDLMKRLYKERKMFDFVFQNFERSEGGGMSRIVTYTLALNYSLGPKQSPTTMKQIFHKENKPGCCYVVDTEVKNQGIPYADSFYVHSRYCLTRLFGNRSRMRIHAEIVNTKSVIGIMKNMIIRNADDALVDYYNHLALYLRQESDLLPSQPQLKKKRSPLQQQSREEIKRTEASKPNLLKTKESSTSPTPPRVASSESYFVSSWLTTRMPSPTTLFLCMLLFFLSINTFLLYRVYKLESLSPGEGFCGRRNTPTTHEEWEKLVQHQKQAYALELKRLRDVIGGTAQLVKQVERSISELYKELEESETSSSAQNSAFSYLWRSASSSTHSTTTVNNTEGERES